MSKVKFTIVIDLEVSLFNFMRASTYFDEESCKRYAKKYLGIIRSHDVIDCGEGVMFRKEEEE